MNITPTGPSLHHGSASYQNGVSVSVSDQLGHYFMKRGWASGTPGADRSIRMGNAPWREGGVTLEANELYTVSQPLADFLLEVGLAERGFPSWRQEMTARTWVEVPTTGTLADIDPAADPLLNENHPGSAIWRGIVGQPGIISAYSGACFDTDTDTFWLPLQGGHGDYAGNEPYKVRFDVETPEFVMLRPPSGALTSSPFVEVLDDGQQSTGLYSDGRMRAIHSYNKHVYVPDLGPVCSGQGDTYPGQSGTNNVIIFDPETGEAEFGAACPVSVTPGSAAAYDLSRHCIWHRGSSGTRFHRYDITADDWEQFGGSLNVSGNSALCYMPEHDCLLWLSNSSSAIPNRFAVLDCDTGTITQPSISGSLVGTANLAGEMSPQWVPDLGGAALWHNSTSRTVINLLSPTGDPRTDPWVISQISVDESNSVTPTTAAAVGTFGRFAYSPRMSGFFLLNATNQKPYFFALD